MLALYAINFYILLLILIPSAPANGEKAVKATSGSLWCVEGEKKSFSPVQCPAETTECFKFVCDGVDEAFVARGCGLSVLISAAGLPNESCHQAQSICEYVGGRSSCHTCNNKHMCNSTSFSNYLMLFIIISLVSTIMVVDS